MILAGVMGDPIAHSLSPMLHGHWLKKHDIQGAYLPLHVKPENLEQALRALHTLGFAGVNLTLPHKEHAIDMVDSLSSEAKKIGAANTIVVRKNGSLHGTNTDAYGFTENLKSGVRDLSPYLEHCVVLGAGGAARAVIYGLLKEGAKRVTITNRTITRAEELASHFGKKCTVVPWEEKEAALAEASLLVNTTALGMKGKSPLELSLHMLPKSALVTDIVYTPLMTSLLQKAKRRGNPIVDGLGMLLHQARPGFEAWYGKSVSVDTALTKAIKRAL